MSPKSKVVKQLLSRAESLATKFQEGGGRDHIDAAIALDREALELCPSGHSMRDISLTQLAIHLAARYRSFWDMSDIEEGVVLSRAALELRPPGHPDRYQSLGNLAFRLSTRYEQLGAVEDLDEAISLARDVLAYCPPGHKDRPISLGNLALDVHTRYEKLGAIEDLDEAIALSRDALALRPPGDPNRAGALSNLARSLQKRCEKLGKVKDMDEVIALDREALSLCSEGHVDRPMLLNNLAAHLGGRYEKVGVIEDLDEAITLYRDVLRLCPSGHPDRPLSLFNLAVDLHNRYKKYGRKMDLGEAIDHANDALLLYPPGHPDRSASLQNLAFFLRTRFRLSRRPKDKKRLFDLYAQLTDIPPMVSSEDISVARQWINAAEHFRHPTTPLAYETSLRLLHHHLATLPSLPQHLNLIHDATSSIAVDAFSACLRNGSPTKAVELLEQGRGVFLSQLTRLRSPVDVVRAAGPEGKSLADEFMSLTSLIRDAFDPSGVNQHDRVCRLNVQLQKVVLHIRKLPGLSHFLLPPNFLDLRVAAIAGPVIIVNASKHGCDALVVLHDRDPVHIPLQIARHRVRDLSSALYQLTVQTKLTNLEKYLAVILRELWETTVSPIVDVLQAVHPLQSRVWWCPTAEFSLLPLHAAGTYRKAEWRRFSDLYISSYTPTLTSLIRARRVRPFDDGSGRKRFVAIGEAKAIGESELHSVSRELANITERVKSHAVVARMEGSESTISNVVRALEENQWVHLACHGLPNRRQPFQSAFGLYDGRLTIERPVQRELSCAEFAYLSACHTTVGEDGFPDEMIHLASSMQFAGFQSVVGTMWAVDDEQAATITAMFYEHVVDASGRLDHTRAALALHNTMKKVKGISFDQRILYVHLGA